MARGTKSSSPEEHGASAARVSQPRDPAAVGGEGFDRRRHRQEDRRLRTRCRRTGNGRAQQQDHGHGELPHQLEVCGLAERPARVGGGMFLG
jgi:hypothetical protein